MNQLSEFRLTDPIERDLHDVGKCGLTTYLAGGIVNPVGPTLTVIAADGTSDPGQELSLLHIVLNPFSQVVTEVGQVTLREEWDASDLQLFFSLPFGDCPTLLLPSFLLPHEVAVTVYGRFLASFDGGFSVLERVRANPGDPWTRVQRYMDGVAANPSAPRSVRRPLNDAEAREFAEIQLTPSNMKVEIMAFLAAWDGAIEFAPASLRRDAMGFAEFLQTFALVTSSCTVPALV